MFTFNEDRAAKDLQQRFPRATGGFSQKHVKFIWKDYSNDLAASWMISAGRTEAEIARVFRRYRLIDGKLYRLIEDKY